MMKRFKKIMAVALTLCLSLSAFAMTAFAANVTTEPLATIDMTKKASFTLYKYDFTNAQKDGVWDEDSFVSTGIKESYVEETLGGAIRIGDNDKVSDLGNGQTSNGYAIKGVEFTMLKVAEITTFTESERDGHAAYNKTMVLYGFDKTAAADLLAAIGLADGKDRYTNAGVLDATKYYYTSDTLAKALSDALGNNSTTVKNALEAYIAKSGDKKVMNETDADGMSTIGNLDLGLYIVVETKVPEMVTSTTDPFFVSLPMTTVTGDANSDSEVEGGHQWNYDVYVYPKNNTGIPTLEKTVRESKEDTGDNNGTTDDITDGYEHTATASSGDVVEYQIISTLPNITSTATYLSVYKFFDTISAGLSYDKTAGVKIEIFKDKECTTANRVATWTEADGKFTVEYTDSTGEGVNSTMTIDITEAGLAEINGVTTGNTVAGELATAYSNHTIRITYSATVDSDTTTIIGDGFGSQDEDGNCNKVVLTWKRSNNSYLDTLIDDCHVYTFGLELTKLFSDKESSAAAEQFAHVKFKIWNDSDKYWVKASLNAAEGIYYVTDHVAAEADATEFVPVTSGDKYGVVIVKGLENDTYIITECETANGYTLLKDSITVVISVAKDKVCDIYSEDVRGVLQNDPRYSFDGDLDLHLENIPQDHLAHQLLTASATVDGNDVTMNKDDGSDNAIVPLTVVNTRGFDLPQTGERGMWLYPVVGLLGTTGAGIVIVLFGKKKKRESGAE